MTPQQDALLQGALETALADDQILGVMLQGSLARGDGHPGSDMDLFCLLHDHQSRPFASVMHEGILLERHFGDFDRTTRKLQANPMLVYGFLEGRLLYDPTGRLAGLVAFAQNVRDTYQTPPETLAGIVYWLQSARIKISAADSGGDWLKAAFVVSTTTWKMLEGLWALNNRPMPPSGSVLSHLPDLKRHPPDLDGLIDALFLGQTAARIGAAVTLIDWIVLSSHES